MLLNHDHVEDEEAVDNNQVHLETSNNDSNDTVIPKTRENFVELTKYIKIYFEPNVKKF
jgi:hypothetical protein